MCGQGLQSQCDTTQVRDQGKGAALLGYTKLYGQVPGGQAECLGQHREPLADPRIGGQVAVGHTGADPQAAVAVLDLRGSHSRDVHHQFGSDDAQLQVVHEVGAAAEEHGTRVPRDCPHGGRRVRRGVVFERPHLASPASRTASTMFT